MKRTLATLALLALSACGGGTMTRADTVAALTGVAANGQGVYSNNCASCHLATGAGTSTYPSLVASVKSKTASEFLSIVINGKSGTAMVSYASLTDQQLADVYAYVKNTLAK